MNSRCNEGRNGIRNGRGKEGWMKEMGERNKGREERIERRREEGKEGWKQGRKYKKGWKRNVKE